MDNFVELRINSFPSTSSFFILDFSLHANRNKQIWTSKMAICQEILGKAWVNNDATGRERRTKKKKLHSSLNAICIFFVIGLCWRHAGTFKSIFPKSFKEAKRRKCEKIEIWIQTNNGITFRCPSIRLDFNEEHVFVC